MGRASVVSAQVGGAEVSERVPPRPPRGPQPSWGEACAGETWGAFPSVKRGQAGAEGRAPSLGQYSAHADMHTAQRASTRAVKTLGCSTQDPDVTLTDAATPGSASTGHRPGPRPGPHRCPFLGHEAPGLRPSKGRQLGTGGLRSERDGTGVCACVCVCVTHTQTGVQE